MSTAAPAGKLPSSLAKNPRLSQWLRLTAEGTVEVCSGKVEIGQGILTALAQIVAEELDVQPSRVRMMRAVTGSSPDEGVTSGSLSTQDSGTALRHVCAEARALLLQAAGDRLDYPVEALTVSDGVIHGPGGARATYWDFAQQGLLDRDATASVAPKARAARTIVGQDAARIDLPDKVMGRARYVHDLALPGLLHGRVLRPPSPAATLDALDDAPAKALPGVIAVVRDGSFVGVIAEHEETALAALERLRRGARWNESASLPDAGDLAAWLVKAPSETSQVAERGMDTVPRAHATRRAHYTRPYVAHASIGPSCALARWDDAAHLHVWSHTQGVYNLRADLVLVFGLAPGDIVVEHAEGAGCYGHNGADDVAFDAALLARAVPGRPVRVVWSREDELGWSPFGPAMAVEIAADVDERGDVLAWHGEIWSNGHTLRPGRAAKPVLLAATHLARPFERQVSVNPPFAGGGGAERNSVPAYDFPALRVTCHRLTEMPVRASALRSLGACANVFAIESFVDDLARERGEDPLAWRLRHISDPRARAVLEAAAQYAPEPL